MVGEAGASFAHASEAELARILDFYDVRWAYEPDTFPIGWNLDGDVVESFSPDFYLPELDLYIELTTLKQKLVRKKNRKLRRLRELYPDIRIKLFYARDFRMLMLKFGRMALIDEMTGTTGQATPPRAVAAEADVRAVPPGSRVGVAGQDPDPANREPDPAESAAGVLVPEHISDAPVAPAAASSANDETPAAVAAAGVGRGRRRGRRRRGSATNVTGVSPAPAESSGGG